MALQNSSIESMNTFLNRIYYIPNYQREYSWEQTELEDFWDDLEATKNDEEMNHFFGQVVIHNDENNKKKYIIDGQQRTITSTIFMRVLQLQFEQLYKESGMEEADYKKSDIASIHIGRKDKLHLTLGQLDNDYFRENIQLGQPDKLQKGIKKSHERLKKAFFYFTEKLDAALEICCDSSDKLDCLTEYYDTFVSKFNVLYMEATKLEEAFVIFETLNARGRDLETADLLKNFIFSQSKDIDVAQNEWNRMVNQLDKTDPTKYIRHYWNSCNSFTRDKALYRAISKNVSNPRKSKELLKNLDKYAQCYHDMVTPSDNIGFKDEKLIQSLKALKTLKASTFYPVVLAMKQAQAGFSETDIQKVVANIESYVFRNSTICGKTANKAEIFFAELAKDIYDGVYDDVNTICRTIKDGMASDQEFGDAFERWSGTKNGKEIIRYILRKIHKHLDADMEINIDTSEVHIEHIMPEDASQWNVDEETHDEYLWRLGNLTLLAGTLNISASNKPFDEKKDKYAASKIEPNKDLAAFTCWDKAAIEKRQQKLREYAVKIWEG